MERIKSSYEIAMERAEEMLKDDNEREDNSRKLEIREELKAVMSKYFKGELDADGLWQELNDKDDVYLAQAQEMIIESFGLRTSEDDFAKRKEGILAIENLKNSDNSSIIEQVLNKLNELQQRHQSKREQMEEQFKERMEQQAEMQMKPVQTDDGRTVMKLDSGVDRESQKRMKQQLSQLEEQSEQMFNS